MTGNTDLLKLKGDLLKLKLRQEKGFEAIIRYTYKNYELQLFIYRKYRIASIAWGLPKLDWDSGRHAKRNLYLGKIWKTNTDESYQ